MTSAPRPGSRAGVTATGRTLVIGLALGLGLALAGCGKADKPSSASPPAKPPVELEIAAVNALVPAALRSTLVFERRDIVLDRGKRKATYTFAAPRGWTRDSQLFAHLKGDDKAGFASRFEVGSNCDGECTPKPWETIADRVNFAPRATGRVHKDDKAAGRRTMIAEADTLGVPTTVVVAAWWTDGDRSYHTCTATLDDAIKDAAPAFDRACQAVLVDGDD